MFTIIKARILFIGKAKDLTREEIVKAWHFGRKIEPLKSADLTKLFSKNQEEIDQEEYGFFEIGS